MAIIDNLAEQARYLTQTGSKKIETVAKNSFEAFKRWNSPPIPAWTLGEDGKDLKLREFTDQIRWMLINGLSNRGTTLDNKILLLMGTDKSPIAMIRGYRIPARLGRLVDISRPVSIEPYHWHIPEDTSSPYRFRTIFTGNFNRPPFNIVTLEGGKELEKSMSNIHESLSDIQEILKNLGYLHKLTPDNALDFLENYSHMSIEARRCMLEVPYFENGQFIGGESI